MNKAASVSEDAEDDWNTIDKVDNADIISILIQQHPVIRLYNDADEFHTKRYTYTKDKAVPREQSVNNE